MAISFYLAYLNYIEQLVEEKTQTMKSIMSNKQHPMHSL